MCAQSSEAAFDVWFLAGRACHKQTRKMTQLVFVYGTLRRGEANQHLLRAARCLGRHKTEPRYTMFSLGAWPAITDGGNTAIVGDVFRVDTPTVAMLDEFENHPNEYVRRRIETPFGNAWVYIYRQTPTAAVVVPSGDWCDR